MDDGRQLLMYTSVVSEKQPNGEMRDIQTQSVAVGDGLITKNLPATRC